MKKPYITECEDGSILIEFIKEDKRFSICLEVNLDTSSWNYIDSRYIVGVGELPEKMIEFLKEFYKD